MKIHNLKYIGLTAMLTSFLFLSNCDMFEDEPSATEDAQFMLSQLWFDTFGDTMTIDGNFYEWYASNALEIDEESFGLESYLYALINDENDWYWFYTGSIAVEAVNKNTLSDTLAEGTVAFSGTVKDTSYSDEDENFILDEAQLNKTGVAFEVALDIFDEPVEYIDSVLVDFDADDNPVYEYDTLYIGGTGDLTLSTWYDHPNPTVYWALLPAMGVPEEATMLKAAKKPYVVFNKIKETRLNKAQKTQLVRHHARAMNRAMKALKTVHVAATHKKSFTMPATFMKK